MSESDSYTIDLFSQFLTKECSGCSYLFILGDLFDYWIGDDSLHFKNLYSSFKQLSKHTSIYFICGNRDFLVGEAFFKATNIMPLPEVSLIKINNQEIIIMHGDTLCTDDIEYQEFRKESRSNSWKNDFLSKPLKERMVICNELRIKSQEAKENKAEYIMDVNLNAVKKVFSEYDFPPLLIHGHTHRLKSHRYVFDKNECKRWVLGDWHGKGNFIALEDNKPKYFYLSS